MKNYGLQLKEIPIIFRGQIEAGTSPEPPEPPEPGVEFMYQDENTQVEIGENDLLSTFDVDDPSFVNVDNSRITITEISYYVDDMSAFVQISDPPKRSLIIGDNVYYYWGGEDHEITDPDNPYVLEFENFPDKTRVRFEIPYNGPELGPDDPIPVVGLRIAGYIAAENQEEEITPTKKTLSYELTGNGSIRRFYVRFAVGENGTLHIRPYVILNGNIRVDLCNFAEGGNNYISGDDETISFDCFVPVETHAVAYVEAENVGEYESIIDAAMVVQYEDYIEAESIVGYEGINLRRGK